MDYVLAKIKSKTGTAADKVKKLLSDITLYSFDLDSISSIPYDPATSIDDCEWFEIKEFSKQEYCVEFLKTTNESVSFTQFSNDTFPNIEYICSCQNNNEYYFQKVSKTQLIQRNVITLGDEAKYKTEDKCIVINDIPDAIYVKTKDCLFFKILPSITSIFKGIDQLYKEATEEETTAFLEQEFIALGENFNANKVKKPNRKRIALAIKTLESFEEEQKKIVLDTVKEYCPNLLGNDGKFNIESDDDLKLLLWGIEQRFYTTPDGNERRIANSIIKMN